jgi:hypothetical protein
VDVKLEGERVRQSWSHRHPCSTPQQLQISNWKGNGWKSYDELEAARATLHRPSLRSHLHVTREWRDRSDATSQRTVTVELSICRTQMNSILGNLVNSSLTPTAWHHCILHDAGDVQRYGAPPFTRVSLQAIWWHYHFIYYAGSIQRHNSSLSEGHHDPAPVTECYSITLRRKFFRGWPKYCWDIKYWKSWELRWMYRNYVSGTTSAASKRRSLSLTWLSSHLVKTTLYVIRSWTFKRESISLSNDSDRVWRTKYDHYKEVGQLESNKNPVLLQN